MASFDGLSPLTYFGDDWAEVLVAIGWLGPHRAYARGEVHFPFVDALVTHLRHPWQPVAAGGVHRCEFCRLTDTLPTLSYRGQSISMGSSNLFIPGDGRIYCAPSMIAHYIDAHGYRPPDAFMQAVLDCPLMHSMAYRKQLLACGGGRLLPSRYVTGAPADQDG